MKKLITIALLALATTTTAHAKIGDTFTDPEFGKITVKAPAFPEEENMTFENGEIRQTKQRIMVEKTSKISVEFDRIVDRLHPNMTEKEIIAETKEFIKYFKELKPLRKSFYIDGYNQKMLMFYTSTIKDGQRAFKYKFWDYLLKIEGTPEFEELRKEINFSTQILKNLKLYEEN